ncbi:cytochrome o ubiquinol oxidase subunit IV [Paracoccus laeviglucosivorans]|uniref:Cytochrome bo(3) ubiquinol oxidase subunit 4 n=1 Tax=Paracoccus laeviglucosivorans TaxID=1197861 RepID=A0A521B6A2_9RHOB|nr:cytochrome o ubiquinol oxidase subunit IV [Paracoccus laeviglucosivorans]SMO42628.1 cytochrome ba3 quinol oxidase subunit 4 [Paracoccus laeviglucosivorans]
MAHSHNHHDAHHGHGDHAEHTTYRGYVTGFILAVILTVIPFGVVMGGGFDSRFWTITLVVLCAVAQVLVHMIYFLHMDSNAEEGWTLLSTIFTIVVVVIMIAGSLWVMFHLNTNMMPQMNHELQVMP